MAGKRLLGGILSLVLGALNGASAEWSSFQAGSGGWHLGTLAVENLDGDPVPEIVVPYRDTSGRWYLDAFKLTGARVGGFPYGGTGEEINVSPTIHDLNGDGSPEIIFTQGNRVVVLRGDGSVLWTRTLNRLNYIPNGGYMTEIGGFHWSDGGGWIGQLPANAVFSSQVSSPLVVDIDGDGQKEVITAWKIDPDSTSSHQDFNPSINDVWGFGEWGTVGETWSGGVAYLKAGDGAVDYIFHFHQMVESGLAFGQADDDGPLETYVLNDSDSVVCFDRTRPHGFHGNGTLHKQFGKNQRLVSGSYQVGVDVYTVDIDGDGRAEVLVPTTRRDPLWQSSDTVLDDDGTILWRSWKDPASFSVNQWQNNACMIPVNPDRDNRVDVLTFAHSHEIDFRYWDGAELISHPGWPRSFFPEIPTPPVMGDVDGDGKEDIVVGTYHPDKNPSEGLLYVLGLDGTVRHHVAVPGGLKQVPALADVNQDGGLEVIYRSLSGRVYVQNFGASQQGPVSWPCHRGNNGRDGNFARSIYPPGTPLVTQKSGGYQRASFSWTVPGEANFGLWRILRSDEGRGPYQHIVTLAREVRSFTDVQLENGRQYFYKVVAAMGTNTIASPPFVVTCSLERNLIANGGFEENDHSHWDKWFTGDIEWTNMVGVLDPVHSGRKAMQVSLFSKSSNGSISQYGQYGTPDAYLPVTNGLLYSFGGFLMSSGLDQPSEHWFEWGSTPTGEFPTARPSRPWPYYFTPHLQLGPGSNDWFYLNRTFQMPPGFPNVELGHRFSMASGSGRFCLDDVFFRSLPAPEAAVWKELIPFGAAWRYFTNSPPADWFHTGFHDAQWSSGRAKFGAGSGPTNIATRLPANQPAYYFRKVFQVNAANQELLLSATCTEGGAGLEVYLNGERLPTSGIEVGTGQGNRIEYFDLSPFAHRLIAGTNFLAVVLQNAWQSGWDDVAFDLRLQAMPLSASKSGLFALTTTYDQNGKLETANVGLRVEANSLWRLEVSDSLDGDWRLWRRVTPVITSVLWFLDSDLPGTMRFYRLVPD